MSSRSPMKLALNISASLTATGRLWVAQKVPAIASLVRVGRALSRNDRLVLPLDELDKLLMTVKGWERSVMTDVWNLVDGQFPWELVALVELMCPASESAMWVPGRSGERDIKDRHHCRKTYPEPITSGSWAEAPGSLFSSDRRPVVSVFKAKPDPNQWSDWSYRGRHPGIQGHSN